MKTNPIKPCPFCGSEPLEPSGYTESWIRCSNDACKAFGPSAPDQSVAITLWNKRPRKQTKKQ